MKKKGFTLIELLAVIVVLAIILVLAVPKILDLIEKADRQAYKESAELMAHTAQIQYQTKEVTGSAPVIPDEGIVYTFEEGVQTVSGNYDLLKFKGDKPYSGTITLTKDKKVIIEKLVSKNKKWCAIKEAGEKQARVGRSTDPEFACVVEEDAPIVDKKECELEIGKVTIDDVEKEVYYIDSPSDLYALSQSVNSGNSYSGKIIKVRNDLDMSTAEGECVSDFSPIGTKANPFSGTFDGGAKKISNLTIDKSQNNVGLFGYVKGIDSNNIANIYGIRLINDIDSDNNPKGSIKGTDNVGGLVGYVESYTSIKEIELDNMNVYGGSYIGEVFGTIYNGNGITINNILVKNGKVKGWNHIGYIAGHDTNLIKNAIVENVNLTVNCTTAVYAHITSSSNNTYHSNASTVNGTASGFDSSGIDDINFYELAGLDTWIGGDDGTGYYFDYDESNKVILKSVEKNPITFNLSKNNEGYYLIKNEKDWKEASTKTSEKYKLMSNLDFSTKKYYMLGSVQDNYFSGTLIGNNKIVSNVTINAQPVNYSGLIGYVNGGTIYDLLLKNIKVSGYDNVGIFGYVKGIDSNNIANIYGIRLINEVDENENSKGSIKGNNYVGGLVGYVGSYTTIKEIELDNVDVYGSTHNISGFVGYVYNGDDITINNILAKNGKVKGWNHIGYIAGHDTNLIKNAIVENVKLTVNCTTAVSAHITSSSNNTYHSNVSTVNGTASGFDSSGIDDINFYELAGLDTWIGGDNDNSGYYFDYDENNKIILKNVKQSPITFNLNKDSDEYYLIKNEKDWKIASSKPQEKYKLENNLDFSSNKYYMLGSIHTPFSGTLVGNDKMVSNVTINAQPVNYVGLIGYVNGGTIYDLVLKNIKVSGCDNVGIFGYVSGIEEKKSNISVIRIINDLDELDNSKGSIKGKNYIGGLVGYVGSYTTIKEIELDNIDVYGSTHNISGFVGYVYNGNGITINNILVKNGKVKGWNHIGYIAGHDTNLIKNAIVENVNLTVNCTTAVYAHITSSSNNTYHSNASTVNGTASGFDLSYIDKIYYYKDVLETLFTGDVNNTGYFFDVADDGKIHLVKAYTLTPPTTEDTGESIGPSTGVCSRYPCTCECGCICNDGSDGATQTRCEAGCGLN